MRRSLLIFFGLWACFVCAGNTFASIVLKDFANGYPTMDYPFVGCLGIGSKLQASATAIFGGQYALTAKHVVTTDGSITGPLRAAASIYIQYDKVIVNVIEVDPIPGADLAILKLDSPAPSWIELWPGSTSYPPRPLFKAIGFGQADPDLDGRWGPGKCEQKRYFENRVESFTVGGIPGQGSIMRYRMDFGSEAVSDLEGISGPGDSGGAVLCQNNQGQYLLAGLISSAGEPAAGATGSIVQIMPYYDSIRLSVPSPSSLTTILLAGPFLLTLRLR